MKQRISFFEVPKGMLEGLMKVDAPVKASSLDPLLLELIKNRVSQINGCAFCIDMHHKDAIHLGESEQRIHGLNCWRETPYYTPAERAVLAFSESLTIGCKAPDDIYNELAQHFNKEEIAYIALQITTINSWNRLNAAFGTIPGKYKVNAQW